MDDSPMSIPLTSDVSITKVFSASRGASQQGTVPVSPIVPDNVWQDLEAAIKKGDSLPNTEQKLAAKVSHRALLVAVDYDINWEIPGYGWAPPLLSTPNDIWRIYNMLVNKFNYDPANIRILAPKLSPESMSTKANIMASLEWLVSGAEEGCHRYFHFSGHGDAIQCSRGEGKEARYIPKLGEKINPDDTEIFSGWGHKGPKHQRIKVQDIPVEELTYYYEAMLTEYVSPGWRSGEALEKNTVRDRELNEVFAKLPKGSTLTCTLDCCHSGRMLNANYKLAGSGFRGEWLGSGTAPEIPSEDPASQTAQTDRAQINQAASAVLHNYFVPPVLSVNVEDVSAPKTRGVQPPKTVRMLEALPNEERIMDKISATMLSWSAAQLRQTEEDYNNWKGGLFTHSFIEAIDNAPKDITVDELHKNVDAIMRSRQGHVQYCQVWTSLGDDDEQHALDKLTQPFARFVT